MLPSLQNRCPGNGIHNGTPLVMILPTGQRMPTLEIVDVAIRAMKSTLILTGVLFRMPLHGEQAEVGVGKKQTRVDEIREDELSQSWAFEVPRT
jgi:hypothetical protein